ncbi:MAG: hypothetical protein OXF43_11660 [Gammaproteobacteria bacterium]|nr:hypothetical protein [Gammaproteobacteria bacterium]
MKIIDNISLLLRRSEDPECVREARATACTYGSCDHATMPLADRVSFAEMIRVKVRKIEQKKTRLARERQYNRRVKLNSELRTATQELRQSTPDYHRTA